MEVGIRIGSTKPETRNKKRGIHIQAALDKYDGWIDAVIVDGSSKEGVENASPLMPKDRKDVCSRVTYFEASTGHVTLSSLPKNLVISQPPQN